MESKSKTPTCNVSTQIQELHNQLEQWRQTRRYRGPMPEWLWAMATEVARRHGVARVARQARLDYYSLKERLDAHARQDSDGSKKEPAFVELSPLVPSAITDCTVELEHPRGARMRIHLKGAAAPDLTSLASSFWSAVS